MLEHPGSVRARLASHLRALLPRSRYPSWTGQVLKASAPRCPSPAAQQGASVAEQGGQGSAAWCGAEPRCPPLPAPLLSPPRRGWSWARSLPASSLECTTCVDGEFTEVLNVLLELASLQFLPK